MFIPTTHCQPASQTQEKERSSHSETSQKDNAAGPMPNDSNTRKSPDEEVDVNSKVEAEQPNESGRGAARDGQSNCLGRKPEESSRKVLQTKQSKPYESKVEEKKADPIYENGNGSTSSGESEKPRATEDSTVSSLDSGHCIMFSIIILLLAFSDYSTISSLDIRHYFMFGVIVLLLAYIYTNNSKI